MNWLVNGATILELPQASAGFLSKKLKQSYLYHLCYGRPRNRELLCVSPSRKISKAPLPSYEGFDVGVYEGEFVVIGKWVGQSDNHQMVVCNRRAQDLDYIPEELNPKIYQLADFWAVYKQ